MGKRTALCLIVAAFLSFFMPVVSVGGFSVLSQVESVSAESSLTSSVSLGVLDEVVSFNGMLSVSGWTVSEANVHLYVDGELTDSVFSSGVGEVSVFSFVVDEFVGGDVCVGSHAESRVVFELFGCVRVFLLPSFAAGVPPSAAVVPADDSSVKSLYVVPTTTSTSVPVSVATAGSSVSEEFGLVDVPEFSPFVPPAEATLVADGVAVLHYEGVHVAWVDLAVNRVNVSPFGLQHVGAYGGVIAVNGSWFTTSSVDGVAVSNGFVYGGPDHDYTAPVVFGSNFVSIDDHSWVGFDHSNVSDALSGHPTLVWNYAAHPALSVSTDPTVTDRHPRTAVGYTGSTVIFVVVDGRSKGPGASALELANMFISFGAERALMLDGGGSSAMTQYGEYVSSPSESRRVGNQLYVTPR